MRIGVPAEVKDHEYRVAIDQGGCFEGSRPTTYTAPTSAVHDSLFYCVANMPGAVPHTSTYALTNVTLPDVVALADLGWHEACRADASLARGLNTHGGAVTYAPVAETHGLEAVGLDTLLGNETGVVREGFPGG